MEDGRSKPALRCSIAVMPTLIRWWEALRAQEVEKWQQKYRVDWDATDGEKWRSSADSLGNVDGDAEIQISNRGRRTVSSSFQCWTWRRPSSESVFLWCGPGRRISASRGTYCGCSVGFLSTRGGCSLKDLWRSRHAPSRPSFQGQSGVACFYLLCCRLR